jgi:hypothetical protein
VVILVALAAALAFATPRHLVRRPAPEPAAVTAGE